MTAAGSLRDDRCQSYRTHRLATGSIHQARETIIGAIDVHAHFYPPAYVREVDDLTVQEGAAGHTARRFIDSGIIRAEPHFTGDLAHRLAMMDAGDIDIQVLSMASMNIWHPDPETRLRLTSTFNDGLAEVCEQYPNRFRFVATVPFPHVDAAIDEARRARDLPGCIGFGIPTTIAGRPIDAAEWAPIYAQMATRPSLVTVHPDGFSAPGLLSDYSMEWAIGAVFEDTIAAVRLLCSRLIRDHPNIRWLVPHLGGTLPFVLHRLLWRWRFEAESLGIPLHDAADLDRLLFDTANSTTANLQLAAAVLPAGSLAYGTDFPFLDKAGFTASWHQAKAFVNDAARGAPDAVLDLVYGEESLRMGAR